MSEDYSDYLNSIAVSLKRIADALDRASPAQPEKSRLIPRWPEPDKSDWVPRPPSRRRKTHAGECPDCGTYFRLLERHTNCRGRP
jgi:hypothetical protein